MSVFEALPPPAEAQIRRRTVTPPAWGKQTTRQQGVIGKLLEDQAMNKFLNGTGNQAEDRFYVPDPNVKAGSFEPHTMHFSKYMGRDVPIASTGSRLAASSMRLDGRSDATTDPEGLRSAERVVRPRTTDAVRISRQLPRNKAVQGHLLQDTAMRQLLSSGATSKKASAGAGPDGAYDGIVNDTMHTPGPHRPRPAVGHVDMSRSVGRDHSGLSGSRLAANGTTLNHWRATKPASIALTRPRSVKSGVGWDKQISRQQAVVGKLLEDQAMNKFLNGAGAQGGADFYDADDSIIRRATSSVPHFSKQTDRLTAVSGKLLEDRSVAVLSRAAAGGDGQRPLSKSRQSAERRRMRGEDRRRASTPSASAEPSMAAGGYGAASYGGGTSSYGTHHVDSFLEPRVKGVRSFGGQVGRVPFHSSGQRNASGLQVAAPMKVDLLRPESDHLFTL